MKKILFLLLLLPFLGNSQATFTAPVGYNTGAPTAAPSGVGTRWRFDLLTGKKYTWLPGTLSWDEDARGIDQVAGCSAPLYTPGYNQSTFAVNACSPPVLYQWTGAAWEIPNEPEIYTAGTGISIDGSNVISNTAPNVVQELSIDGQDLTLSGGGGTVAIPGGGNGIYGGSGSIPYETVASLLEEGTFRVAFFDESPAMQMDDLEGRIEFNSGNGGTSFYLANGGFGIGATSLFSFNNANAPNNLVYDDIGPGIGISYAAEYPDILTNDRSIPDVGLVNLLKQTPVSYTNAAAPNNCIFYSTTLSKLAYKDPGGTVNPLY